MLALEIKNYAIEYLENEKENFYSRKNYTFDDYLWDIDIYFQLDLERIKVELEQYHWVDYEGLKRNYAKFLVKTYIMVLYYDIKDKNRILKLYYSQYIWHKKNNPFNSKKEFILL